MGHVVTFAYTGAAQTWVVPANVTSVTIELIGGAGGATSGGGTNGGSYNSGVLTVVPGETLQINVGGVGGDTGTTTAGAGGWNGGGSGGPSTGTGLSFGGRGGGGATDIRRGAFGLANRLAVSGGGGGSSGNQYGGIGGGTTGGTFGTNGGAGGSQVAGGAVGAGGGDSPSAGALGVGGTGAANAGSAVPHFGGGGGGGGYYGGGGGGCTVGTGTTAGGGGGGSDYYGSAGYSTGTTVLGYNLTTNGSAIITYNTAPVATPTTPVSGGYVDATTAIPFAWTFTDADTDSQYSANLRYRITGATPWTTITGFASTANTATLTAGTLINGNQYEWQVQVVDDWAGYGGHATSAWSSSMFVNCVLPPSTAPTFTSPAASSALTANPTTFTWTTPTTQQSYQFRMVNDVSGSPGSTVAYLSAETVTATHSSSPTWPTQANGSIWHMEVRYSEHSGSGLWSPWADNGPETLNISPPPVPGVTPTADSATASMLLTITNTGSVSYNRVYRKDITHAGAVEVLIKDNLAVNTNYRDYLPALATLYTWRVEAVSTTNSLASTSVSPAAIVLNRAIVIDPASPTTQVVAGSLPGGRRRERALDGEVRKYAGGRRRAVTRPGLDVTIPITLVWLTEAQATQMDAWRGRVVLYRDPFGRRIFGVYFTSGDTYFAGLSTQKSNVDFSLTEVTYLETGS